ncbi:hypothetical protein Gotri_022170 [Gossypium trilobum]|uniref:Bifunctional inhibitor/plant lipid transfer protein/seed storage helical domain-containing protein n=1 Tax=Gossypium trilobum TaxID=34281 RepID=A0A7J9DEU3_9ROSI|nr:hypothetical protein [Gossypium trilobum]
MAKLAVYLATLALILFLANASITSVTVESEENRDSCEQQIRKQAHLKHCQKYMEEEWGGEGSDNIAGGYIDSCCQQLEKMDTQCRCQGLRHATMQQMQQMQEQMGSKQMREIMQKVTKKIMSECEMEPGSIPEFSRGVSWILKSSEPWKYSDETYLPKADPESTGAGADHSSPQVNKNDGNGNTPPSSASSSIVSVQRKTEVVLQNLLLGVTMRSN